MTLLGAAVLTAAFVVPASAQSLTAGSLSGTVVDSVGTPVYQASLTVTDRGTGLARSTQTDRDGRFSLTLLAPSQYDVYVEQLGYRPKLVEAVPVYAGANADVTIVIIAVPPPVTEV
ncbi:MAG TPA: carboxypeptidase-like regulatory domain-containing protein, partial [Mycobacterium sp.]|nr:carboxypeptidase-like regulatory domain-containing protein [Mycobacterium sp.]